MLGSTVNAERAESVLSLITALVSSWTRGGGFTAGVPADDVRAVILTSAARLLSNATGLLYDEVEGPSQVSYRSAFNGFTLAEQMCLDRYKVMAL
ncbi:hypothetical protein [Mycobacterium intracellulare]|uniref:hypothetical protein n=1 Tax=Mycobacterium intracellulare TaxID=1767 RepID=UPI001CDAFF50|nr:hypothetical protein [Mycobacterium intracellulare]